LSIELVAWVKAYCLILVLAYWIEGYDFMWLYGRRHLCLGVCG